MRFWRYRRYEWLQKETTIVGYLPYLVLQANATNTMLTPNGKKKVVDTNYLVGIVPKYDPANPEASLLYSPSEATYISSMEVLREARSQPTRPAHMPLARVRIYTQADLWFGFNGWQYPHWWVGDPFVLRMNLYSRPMRQVRTFRATPRLCIPL